MDAELDLFPLEGLVATSQRPQLLFTFGGKWAGVEAVSFNPLEESAMSTQVRRGVTIRPSSGGKNQGDPPQHTNVDLIFYLLMFGCLAFLVGGCMMRDVQW